MQAPLLIGVGHAVSDLVFRVGDDFLQLHGLTKGTTKLIDSAEADRLLAAVRATGSTAEQVAGGSVANTLWGVGALGVGSALWARLGDDGLAQRYCADLAKVGVQIYQGMDAPATSAPATNTSTTSASDTEATATTETEATIETKSGRCLVFVTPDSERTMATCLGSAGDLDESAVKALPFATTRYVYLEGYLWDNPAGNKALRLAAAQARKHGAQVAFSLSDPFCVERHRGDFLAFIKDSVDLLFANEQEAALLAGAEKLPQPNPQEPNTQEPDKSNSKNDKTRELRALSYLEQLTALCPEVALTRSDKGALIRAAKAQAPQSWRIAPVPPEQLADATGAGDFFAAGYLRARLAGLSPPVAGAFGARAASAVLGSPGARPPAVSDSAASPSTPSKHNQGAQPPTASPTTTEAPAVGAPAVSDSTASPSTPSKHNQGAQPPTASPTTTKAPAVGTPAVSQNAVSPSTPSKHNQGAQPPTASPTTTEAPALNNSTNSTTNNTSSNPAAESLCNQVYRPLLTDQALRRALAETLPEVLPEELARAFERAEAALDSFAKIAL